GEGSVAFMVTYNFPESVTITGLKIHEGSSTINGPAVFDSGISSSNTIVSTSGKGAINIVIPLSYALGPGEVVAMLPKLVANPTGFYVSLETTANPAGALRAQLGALAKPLENFYATNYVLTGVDEAQSLTLIGSDDLQATGGLAAVVINGTSVPFNFGGQPGQISIQVPPPSQISFSGLLYVQLQNATGLLSEPIVVASAKQENINTVATATVDAARYGLAVAPSSIAAMFGTNLATQTARALKLPLPTSLDDTTVYVNGRAARLFCVSTSQINLEIPEDALPGRPASIVVVNKNGIVSRGTVTVLNTVPGIFPATADGKGAPAGVWTADG